MVCPHKDCIVICDSKELLESHMNQEHVVNQERVVSVHHDVLAIFTHYIPLLYEPPRGKTNSVVSEQVQHKSGCTVTEDS